MTYKLILFVFMVSIARSRSQTCGIDDPHISFASQTIRPDPIDDTGALDLVVGFTGNVAVSTPDDTDSGAPYIEASVNAEDQTIIIKTNDNFATSFDENIPRQATSYVTILRTIVINCESENISLALTLYVSDTNNHDPTFSASSYNYKMPMPLMPNVDLTALGDALIAEDVDFSQTDLTFTVDPPDHFSLSTEAIPDTKQYKAILKATEFVRFDAGLTLKITASDGTKSAESTINIEKDGSISIPDVPKFSQLIYEYTYSVEDGGGPTITPVDPTNEIVVTTSDAAQSEVTISDGTYVTASFNKDTKIVTISSSGTEIPSSSEQVLSLTLTLTLNDESSQAAIIVKLPADIVISVPTFTAPYYTATYSTESSDHSVSLDPGQEIGITANPPGLDIKLEGDDHFSVTDESGVWTLKLVNKLDESVLKEGGDIILTLHAIATDDNSITYDGFSSLVIKLPEVLEVPRFAQPTYEGDYQIDTDGTGDKVVLTNGPINIVQADETVDISIVDSDIKNFGLTQGADGWTVIVNTEIDPANTGEKIVLNLQALVATGDVEAGFGTLVITLPPPDQAPVFTETYYTATYNTDTPTHSLILDGDIKTNPDVGVNVIIDPSSFTENFNLEQIHMNKWPVNIATTLPDSDLKPRRNKTFALRTSIEDTSVTYFEDNNLIIKIQDPTSTPRFLEPLYVAEYAVDDQNDATVAITDGPINITSPELLPILTFQLSGSYYDYFEFTMDGNPQISVVKNLEQTIIQENQKLIFILTVFRHGSADVESTVVALNLPHTENCDCLKFDQPAYVFSYFADSDPNFVDQKGQTISLSSDDPGAIVTLGDGPYKNNFKVTQNPDDGTYEIDVTTPLDTNTLDTQVDIMLVLEASLPEFDAGIGVVLINLPKKDSGLAPRFTSSSYSADYVLGQGTERTDSLVLTSEEEISLVSFAGNPTVTLAGTNAGKFNIVPNSDSTGYTVELNGNLDDATLIGEANVVLTLQATIDGVSTVGESTLVIKLPKETAPAAFAQASYKATYNVAEDLDTLTIDQITISGNYLDETTVVLLTSDYDDNFELTGTNPNFDLKVKADLDSTVLTTIPEIVLTLEASLAGSSLKSTSVVVIELPDPPKAPKFSSPVYTADYAVSGDGTSATVTINDPQITTDATDPSLISLTIKDTYVDNFDIAYGESNYQISVPLPLDDNVITNNNEIHLVLSAKLNTGSTDENFATVAVKLPKAAVNVVPKFSRIFYYAEYTHNTDNTPDTVTIATGTPISIVSDRGPETTVTVIENYSGNFKATFDGTNWQLEVVGKLDDVTLDSPEIVVTLQAELPGSPEIGSSSVILSLPGQTLAPIPLFDHPIYKAEYSIDADGVPSVVNADPIAIISTQEELVGVTLDASYENNFKLERDPDSKTWILSLGADPLEDALLRDNTELAITLTAHLDNSVADGAATLVVKLPTLSVAFDNSFYEGSYIRGTTKADDITYDPITVTSGATVEIVAGDYMDKFHIYCPDTTCTLTTDGLDQEVLDSESEIVLVLKATKPDVAFEATATVIISLPLKEAIKAPEFTQASYVGTYKDDGAAPTVELPIPIQIKGLTDLTDITISSDGIAKDSFTITTDGDHFKVETDGVPQDIIDSNIAIVLTLQATNKEVAVPGKTALVIELPKKQSSGGLSFESSVYMGDYDETEGLVVGKSIKVVGDDDHTASVTLSGEHKDLFEFTYTDATVAINVINDGIPQEIIDANAAITVNIVVTKDTDSAEAALVVTLPKSQNSEIAALTQQTYTATYSIKDATDGVTVDNGPITFKDVTDLTDHDITIKDGDEFKDYFSLTLEADHWTLAVTKDLLQETIDRQVPLVLTLVATVKGASAEFGLVIKLPIEESGIVPLTQVTYTATYTIKDTADDEVAVDNGPITFKDVTDLTDHDITIKDGDEFKDYFSLTLEVDHWTLAVTKDLLQETIDRQVPLVLTLVATVKGVSAEFGLVIKLPREESGTVPLTQVTYTATYTIKDTADDEVAVDNGPITFKDVTDLTDHDITIKDEDQFKDYFSLTFETDHWTLSVATDLPKPITDNNVSLLMTLVATAQGVSAEFGLVIKLPKEGVTSDFYFDETVYMSDYNQVEGLVTEKNLLLEGYDGSTSIEPTGDYAEYFHVEYADKIVSVTVPDLIPQTILDENAAISVVIVATKAPASVATTLVVRLPKGQGESLLSFTHVAYIGAYEINDNNDGVVALDNPIQLLGISDISTAVIEIEDTDYQKYFTFTVDTDHWVINVAENLPSSITDNEVSLFLTLKATLNGITGEAGLALTLPKKVVPTSFYFHENAYNAEYMVNNDEATLEIEQDITIDEDPDGTVIVTLGGDYAQYFTVSYTGGPVSIEAPQPLPNDILNLTVISVNIIGTKGEETARATLVVKLPEKDTSPTFYFDEITYIADYSSSGDSPTIDIDEDISLEGDSDSTATVALHGDYEENFQVGYSDGKVSLNLTSPLPDDVVAKESAISLEIEATRNGVSARASLVVRLPKSVSPLTGGDSSGTDTGLIAAVAVLAVLLVASLVGSAVFYYFKFRRGRTYNQMDDTRPSERFRKNSNNPESKRFDHPTRRATGVIKLPLNDEVVGETATDFEPMEKRKSVQFDTINIDEREIEKSEEVDDIEEEKEEEESDENLDADSDENGDDDDDDDDNDNDDEDIEARRTSRV